MVKKLSRRRIIVIGAACVGVGVGGLLWKSAHASLPVITWKGVALGAQAQINLYHDNPKWATERIRECEREIRRLEGLFSLYLEGSAINRLNRDGILKQPDIDFVLLLSKAKDFTALSDGAFDATVQPLWQLYADHFSVNGADPAGPTKRQIQQTLKLVGSDKIAISSTEIKFGQKGMGLTLNGIAQGYITERVTELLADAGFENVLVYLGEGQALGKHSDGRPWTIGIPWPAAENNLAGEKLIAKVTLKSQALATSGGYGSPFSADGRHHHLFDPSTGHSANHYRSVTVVGPGATDADMLSTALSVMDRKKIATLFTKFKDTNAIILTTDNNILRI